MFIRFGKRFLTKNPVVCVFVCVCVLMLSPEVASATDLDDALDELSLYELRNLEITVATKTKKTMRKAPAIVSVITADEIKNMGARNLTDVLKMVPGFGVSTNEWGRNMVEVRGIRTQTSEKILVMVDGHRLNEPYTGGAFSYTSSELSIRNAKQIEIVRGPGSALYGANAFVAVINVVTKNADDVDGAEATLTGGSFDTKKVGLLGGKSFKDLKILGSFDYIDTDGADVTIEADRIAGAPFSTTPGEADLSMERTEAFLKIAYSDFTFRGHFTQKDRGAFIGVAHALTDETTISHKNFWAEAAYAKSFTERFSASLRTYFDYFEQDPFVELFPEGFPGYADGVIATPCLKDRTLGAELQFDTDLSETNHLIVGVSFEHIKQYDVKTSDNFNPWTMEPLESFQDVSAWGNFNKDATRKVWAAYIQDEWAVGENLNFTAGVRYDYYDDFGSSVNPRFAAVWSFFENAELKLLYGQAFRAPNFVELYNDANPSVLGNSDLDAETIKTYEASIGYRFRDSYQFNVNYFYNDIDDLIARDASVSPARYGNTGGATVDGIEVVLRGQYSSANYWKLSYTWQDPEDADTGEELPDVPSHRASFSVNWELCKYLNANTDVLWTGKRPRASGDSRDDMSAYTTVDLSLIAKNFYKGFEIQASVHNLFDEEYEDPDTSGAQQLIPYDYPREGISALITLSYKF